MNPRMGPLWAPASLLTDLTVLFWALLAGCSRILAAALERGGGHLSGLWPTSFKSLEGGGGWRNDFWLDSVYLFISFSVRQGVGKGTGGQCPHAAWDGGEGG